MDEKKQDWEEERLEEMLRALEKDEENEEKRGKQRNVLREIISFLIYAAIIFGCTFLIITFVGQRTKVSGNSMYDTLEDGDNLILEKLSYRFHDPERFDVVVFRFAHAKNVYYIKRIIGLPGETIQIDDEGNIYIDGEVLQEHYGLERIKNPGSAREPITLGEDEYFVLGDNRNDSTDSRDPRVGNIKRDIIIGRAFVRIYPFDAIGFLKHQ